MFLQRSWFRYIPAAAAKIPPAFCVSDPRGRPPAPTSGRTRPRVTRSHVPCSQRLRRRRFAPSTRTDAWRLARSCSVSLPHSFSPSGWNGECSRGLGCAGPGHPATDPHSGIRNSLPSHGRSSGQRFGASAASGAAPSESALSASGASVSRPISQVQCRVCIPLSTLPILLSVQRVACLPVRLA